MFNKKITLLSLVIVLAYGLNAQDCKISLMGKVVDETTRLPLSYVNVFLEESGRGSITDEQGNFEIDSLCPGGYHIAFSHIGCEGAHFHYELEKDTTIEILLSHTTTALGVVEVEGKKELGNRPNLSIGRERIEDSANENLATLIENETGVHLIKNGSGIAKPVIHGLYGNRVVILNNGIIQSGQQWGNDHGPAIDPYVADKIRVLKGASAIEYSSSNFGSVVLVEPNAIKREPHLHGQAAYIFETNGLGHTVNARLQAYNSNIAWRLTGSLKKYGDRHTPDYYLTNTGAEEANLSLQLERTWNNKWFVNFYASTFNTNIGILRGSHIGNLTDLESALSNTVPLYTEDNFSYTINAPKQQVSHHLSKLKADYVINEKSSLEMVISAQLNNRKEFDIRRGGRTDIPALSLLQYTYDGILKYKRTLSNNWNFKSGSQLTFIDNNNLPETGISPLIPDYTSFKMGGFVSLSKETDNWQYNIGLRYDADFQGVATITRTIPKDVIRYENVWHQYNGFLGLKYRIDDAHSLLLNTGFTKRAAAINERYSYGLHQGVSGIEEGQLDLDYEKGFKNTLEYQWFPNANFSFNALAYHQYFKDYIFLNPQNEVRLTIRGAFPVFKYEQTDAAIYGLDLSSQITLGHAHFFVLKYSYIKGEDVKNDIPLVFIPPSRIFTSWTYRLDKQKQLFKNVYVENLELELNNSFVFEQTNLLEEQDFASPPAAYALLGFKATSNLKWDHHHLRCFLKLDNILNVSYRDYMNRQRYFADDLGISCTLGFSYRF